MISMIKWLIKRLQVKRTRPELYHRIIKQHLFGPKDKIPPRES